MDIAFNRFSSKSLLSAGLLLTIYCLWISCFVGIRSDHIFLICLSLFCYFLNSATRKFITAFFIFIIYWIVYDAMRIVPNYTVNTVHIKDLYDLEKSCFGIHVNNILITPNEFLKMHQSTAADVIAGLFYINWVPVPLAFAFYLLFKDKIYFLRFSYAFVLTNLIGFIVYYLYPAAPPWYVEKYGFEFYRSAASSSAGFARVDELLGINLFGAIYSKNANIFAAMPSLHAAYPVVVLFYAIKRRMKTAVASGFIIFLLGIWFAAVYSFHHYIIDVLLGATCAIAAISILERVLLTQPGISNWFYRLSKKI
ncbi:MAG: phosphatase PAP2 family protein [Bacteroidia bacterium]